MEIGVTVIIVSLLYMILVSIVYFSKKKINNTENKIYTVLVKLNLLGLFVELCCCYFVYNRNFSSIYSFINVVVNKLFLIYLLTWVLAFTAYVYYISFNENNDFELRMSKIKNKLIIFACFVYIALFILVNFLPLYYFSDANYVYSYGPATNALMLLCGLSVGFDIFCLFRNIKNIRSKKYYPLFILVLLMGAVVVIRKINPGLIVINSSFAFISVLMYFTIENPDLQFVNELVRNKEIAEKSIEEKSNFLFKMSNEVKEPINNIISLIKSYRNSKGNIEAEKSSVDNIEMNAKELVFTINDVLNISSMDLKKIKSVDSIYNSDRFYEDLHKKISGIIGNLNLNYNVSSTIPKCLYGDSIKIKQVIVSIINNIVDNNNINYLDIDIDNINKYGVVRMIVEIKCDGNLFDLATINNLVSVNTSISDEDENNIDKLNMGYELIFKVIKLLGGFYNIYSNDKETLFKIVFDQKKAQDDYLIDGYTKYSNKNNIVLLCNDKDNLNYLNKFFNNYDTLLLMDSKELIEKIKLGNKYQLIIMEDEMDVMNAYTTIENLLNIDGFNTKCVVILDKVKESIKEHYINDGFDDYILKSDYNKEIERIIKKYL